MSRASISLARELSKSLAAASAARLSVLGFPSVNASSVTASASSTGLGLATGVGSMPSINFVAGAGFRRLGICILTLSRPAVTASSLLSLASSSLPFVVSMFLAAASALLCSVERGSAVGVGLDASDSGDGVAVRIDGIIDSVLQSASALPTDKLWVRLAEGHRLRDALRCMEGCLVRAHFDGGSADPAAICRDGGGGINCRFALRRCSSFTSRICCTTNRAMLLGGPHVLQACVTRFSNFACDSGFMLRRELARDILRLEA
mmetsp:Transcript_164337/g.290962  ORF Transcript_164337/g.290962 Transcript_164337/m.290962 type:complete len:262 (-) Transcript_164337:263-1048(-)